MSLKTHFSNSQLEFSFPNLNEIIDEHRKVSLGHCHYQKRYQGECNNKLHADIIMSVRKTNNPVQMESEHKIF